MAEDYRARLQQVEIFPGSAELYVEFRRCGIRIIDTGRPQKGVMLAQHPGGLLYVPRLMPNTWGGVALVEDEELARHLVDAGIDALVDAHLHIYVGKRSQSGAALHTETCEIYYGLPVMRR